MPSIIIIIILVVPAQIFLFCAGFIWINDSATEVHRILTLPRMVGHHLTYPLVPAVIQHNYQQTHLTVESRLSYIFLDYSGPFYVSSIQFHCTFSISCKILPYYVYYYCILIW